MPRLVLGLKNLSKSHALIKDSPSNVSICFRYDTSDRAQCPPLPIEASERVSCPTGYVYDTSLFPSTAVTEMDMVCADNWISSFAQSLYMAGMLVGSFVFGVMADRWGRLFTLVVAVTVLAVAGSLSALLPASVPLFSTLRYLAMTCH